MLAFSSLLLIALSILYFISFSSTYASSSFLVHYSSQKLDYSFVTSLEKFLKANLDDSATATTAPAAANVNELDGSIWKIETQRLYQDLNSPPPFLRVYVYQMPFKFTYDLLRLFINTYPHTSNLTSNGSPIYRLIEQRSIDYWLWADLMVSGEERR